MGKCLHCRRQTHNKSRYCPACATQITYGASTYGISSRLEQIANVSHETICRFTDQQIVAMQELVDAIDMLDFYGRVTSEYENKLQEMARGYLLENHEKGLWTNGESVSDDSDCIDDPIGDILL